MTTGHIFAFLSATKITRTGPGDDDYTEEYGYVDPSWSRTEIQESRNDCRPVVDCDIRDEDMADYVREAIEGLGYPVDDGDGRFYGQDETTDEDGASWTYSLKFVRKFYGPNGWTEEDWHPANGGVDLSDVRMTAMA